MIDARYVPIDRWPIEPTRIRKSDPFSATYLQTLDLLESELRHLQAREILIQAFFSREQIRNDGWPRAGASPSHPGVILSFTSRRKPLSFPCDQYARMDANLRAIALSLQALRAVDRYGVTRRAEQYQGWAQIEAPVPLRPVFGSKEEAAAYVNEFAGTAHAPISALIQHQTVRQVAYREASRRLHPDHGGSHEQFVKLQSAMEALNAA